MIYILPDTETGLASAAMLRDQQIHQRNGALLIRPDCDGEINHLIEKIIAKDKFIPGEKTVDEINWKPSSIVILVGKGQLFLLEFEKVLPGFTEYFGPIKEIGL